MEGFYQKKRGARKLSAKKFRADTFFSDGEGVTRVLSSSSSGLGSGMEDNRLPPR